MRIYTLFLILRSAISYFLVSCVLLVCLPITLICAFLPKKYRHNKILYFFLALFYRGIAASLLVPIKIMGNKYSYKEPLIIVANHQSAIDIPLVGLILGVHPHNWLALDYYLNAPLLGTLIRRLFVPVNQENKAKAGRALITLLRTAKIDKMHTIIFPEGGRYNDGTIHQFHPGFVLLAKKTGQKVLPVFMPNNGRLFPPGSKLVYWYPIKIVIGEPLEYTIQDTEESFLKKVHDWFEEQNKKL